LGVRKERFARQVACFYVTFAEDSSTRRLELSVSVRFSTHTSFLLPISVSLGANSFAAEQRVSRRFRAPSAMTSFQIYSAALFSYCHLTSTLFGARFILQVQSGTRWIECHDRTRLSMPPISYVFAAGSR
jgi:hypothetical protein